MGNLIASLDFMLRVALILRGVINHGEDKPSCIQSGRYPIRGGLAEKQRLAQALLYLKIFKNHLYYLWHVRVLSIKPCLHTQLPEHLDIFKVLGKLFQICAPIYFNENFPWFVLLYSIKIFDADRVS